ncbi:2OG-Fe(II) oxygenase [uncultured Arcticibacterium sp.]|uniref:2OG-Fe(II) oxygenase n=1 Tax=uncultured Arcticibacterium sp. TaxID=2173042 RepID=UPI0030F75797
METSFEGLIDSFMVNKVGLFENFLSTVLSDNLKNNLLSLYAERHMKAAGIGSLQNLQLNKEIRSDMIYWLDRNHNNEHENSFFDFMDAFVKYLNETCYAGITSYEFHYALYEKGSFYKRHFDQFNGNNSRAYSMIMYLNDDWQEGDGGELCVYHTGSPQSISPLNGRCVFFKSDEIDHEVLINHKNRMSVTGWLKVG